MLTPQPLYPSIPVSPKVFLRIAKIVQIIKFSQVFYQVLIFTAKSCQFITRFCFSKRLLKAYSNINKKKKEAKKEKPSTIHWILLNTNFNLYILGPMKCGNCI